MGDSFLVLGESEIELALVAENINLVPAGNAVAGNAAARSGQTVFAVHEVWAVAKRSDQAARAGQAARAWQAAMAVAKRSDQAARAGQAARAWQAEKAEAVNADHFDDLKGSKHVQCG